MLHKCSDLCFVLLLELIFFSRDCSSVLPRESYSGLVDDNEVPEGAATLGFVFDITGSMYDDLVQVIDGAEKILNAILSRKEMLIYNYVLVPFHDPEIGPVTVTTDAVYFQKKLKELVVHGGGDCPEMCIGAVKHALEVSLPNSYMYVFTDASSKDYYLLEEVLRLIQRKGSQVVFVMTGDCGDHSQPGYAAFKQIAATSSGQVFHLQKSDVNEVLNFVKVSLQARKVNLVAIDQSERKVEDLELDIDSNIKEFTISVAGDNPRIFLVDPNGQKVSEGHGLETILNLNNVLIVNVKNPEYGRWRLAVGSNGPHTVRSTGLSQLDFVHGFSREPTENILETYHRPLKGAPNYVLVNATGEDDHLAVFTDLHVLNINGSKLNEIPLHPLPKNPSLFNATSFVPPNDYFYLKVVGKDDKGYPVHRITNTAISPQPPDIPEVSTKTRVIVDFEDSVTLWCYVQSLVPFSVQWYKDGTPLGNIASFQQTSEANTHIPKVSLQDEGVYTCHALNSAGSASSDSYLDVKEPAPVIGKPKNVTTVPGGKVTLSCPVQNAVEHNVTWHRLTAAQFRMNFLTRETIAQNSKFSQLSDGSLQIQNVDGQDEGWYDCVAMNEGGTSREKLYLVVYESPRITITPSIVKFKTGDEIRVVCEAVGYPTPRIWWQLDETSQKDRLKTDGQILVLQSAKAEDEGEYTCLASNEAGAHVQQIRFHYIEAPDVKAVKKRFLIASGDRAVLQCHVRGIPRVGIHWFKDGAEIHSLSYVIVDPSGMLTILGVQESDAGEYRCVAENEAGRGEDNITLQIGAAPDFLHVPGDLSVVIEKDASFSCIARGFPEPTITWSRKDGKKLELSRHTQSSDGTLHIKNAHLSDEGIYICTAENQFGQTKAFGKLTLAGIEKQQQQHRIFVSKK